MTSIFYSAGCILINDFPLPYQVFPLNTGYKLLNHLKGNKRILAMVLVLCSSNSPGHTYMGSRFEFHRRGGGVAFPLHHRGVFALKGSAPSRMYYLAGTEEEPPQPRLQ